MGFFLQQKRTEPEFLRGVSTELLHRAECKVCPLNKLTDLRHPHMQPTGAKHPDVYMLGEAPGADEDRRGVQFVGKAGRVLRKRIPDEWNGRLRWNNCVRTRPPGNRTPTTIEIECCRPSIIRDIEESKPKAIFGFGNIPLHWAIEQTGITKWTGRYVPIQVGKHKCWFFALMHPSYVQRSAKARFNEEYSSDVEFVFVRDLAEAFRLVDELPPPEFHTPEQARSDVDLVTGENGSRDLKRVRDFLRKASEEKVVGMDYETNKLRPYSKGAKLLSVAFATRRKTLSIALDHRESKWEPDLLAEVKAAIKEFLYNGKCRKVAHSLSFEMEWSAFFFGKEVLRASKWGDTLSQAYILDERQGSLSLEVLCIQYYGINIKKLSNLDRTSLDAAPLRDVLLYNGIDAKYHRLLYRTQARELEIASLTSVYRQQLRRVPTMVLSQMKGVPVNERVTKDFHSRVSRRAEKVEQKIKKLKSIKRFEREEGEQFNPGSNHHVKKFFNKTLGMEVPKTDKKVLVDVKHPAAKLILRYREHKKLISTYIEPMMPGSPIIYPDGLMHPVIAVTKTRTWRTSADSPNMQNWPKREHKEIRKQLEPGPGFKVVSFDYAGIQARNIAMESKDKTLVNSYWDGYDIHQDWLDKLVQLYPKWVEGGPAALKDKELNNKLRNRAKNQFVFPSFFGAGPVSIAAALKVPEEVTRAMHEEFWERFSGIKKWHKRIEKGYYANGYVAGLSGFRRRAPIKYNERINSPIQSDEAAIVCDAMSRLSELGEPQYQATLEIHDDLTFIWPAKKVDEYAEVVIGMMLETPFAWAKTVPLGIEMLVGDNWAEQTEVGKFFSNTWKGTLKKPAHD